MKKTNIHSDLQMSNTGQRNRLAAYEKPSMQIIELEQEQYILTGSTNGNVENYGDGDSYSYIPKTNNGVNNA